MFANFTNTTAYNSPWFLSDFSELKKNKHVYTQPCYPSTFDVCMANNFLSDSQKPQAFKNITHYIATYIKHVHILRVIVSTSFDVDQIKYVDSLIKHQHLKVSYSSDLYFYLCDRLYLKYRFGSFLFK